MRANQTIKPKKTRPPARSPEARESQLINAAVDLAEKQIAAGTASSQVITHFLKLATTRERLEKEKLSNETKLLRAKTEALQSVKKIEELYSNALNAMQSYRSNDGGEETDIED